MFARALVAFLALPGVVAFAVPLTLALWRSRRPFDPLGLLLLVPGLAILLWCVRDFHVAGRGTLAPWSPPRRIVTVGLYRWSRNPMYVGVVTILWGWAVAFRSPTLVAYAMLVMLAFHLRVVFHEEPWLAATFGEDWERYRGRVRRWIGRRTDVP